MNEILVLEDVSDLVVISDLEAFSRECINSRDLSIIAGEVRRFTDGIKILGNLELEIG
jgi:hypothetical protein